MTLPTPAEDTATEALAILDSLFEGAHETFDASVDATLGIEEEFAICDPQTLDLVPRYLDIEALAKQSGLEQAVAGELLASEVEFRTGRCMSWSDAEQELTDIRVRVMEIA
ncbi:MAG: glutamate-cysteine ligase family protein, partial [Gaiellales bacterium]